MQSAVAVKKPKRRFSAFGSLDKKTRRWAYLASVRKSGPIADGDDLIFKVNGTTLEVGQGVSNLRGMVWLPLLLATCAGVFIGWGGIPSVLSEVQRLTEASAWAWFVFDLGLASVLVLGVCFAAAATLNDLFGPIDVPLRFDRVRRKVYVWATRKEGPMVLDWDRIKPVAQSVGAPPYQVNQFRSVLLVDEDEDGDVRFEGKLPRIAQIGAALLDRGATLGAYEYVRRFMEEGPASLPPVKRHLVMRPHGWRCFFDVFGMSETFMRPYPSLPKHQRSPGWLVFGVLLIALFSVILIPWQIARGIALKFTTSVPKWSAEYEAMAAEGGPMLPPAGSESNDLPVLPHERVIFGIWVTSAVAVWTLLIAGP
jgi:hypothetical protein